MKILLLFLLIVIALLLCGCSSSKPYAVHIPLPVKVAAPKPIPKPYLPIKAINEKSTHAEVMKAYVATVAILLNWGNAQQLQMEGYR